MKKCSKSLIIWEMQIKSENTLTPVRSRIAGRIGRKRKPAHGTQQYNFKVPLKGLGLQTVSVLRGASSLSTAALFTTAKCAKCATGKTPTPCLPRNQKEVRLSYNLSHSLPVRTTSKARKGNGFCLCAMLKALVPARPAFNVSPQRRRRAMASNGQQANSSDRTKRKLLDSRAGANYSLSSPSDIKRNYGE